MADKIDTVINPRQKMGALEGLFQLAVLPSLRARQEQRKTTEISVEGDDAGLPLLSSRDVVPSVDKTPKPQIASESWRALLAGSFRKVFLGDGYDPSTDSVVTFKGKHANTAPGHEATIAGDEIAYHVVPPVEALKVGSASTSKKHLSGVAQNGVIHTGHAVATFFGVPNRFEQLGSDEQLVFNGWTILRNYTGFKRELFEKKKPGRQYTFSIPGLNWGYIGGEYGAWQTLAAPIKLGIGLPLKLALTVVKFAVNVVKLFTEFLPTLIVNGSAKLIRRSANTFAATWAQKSEIAKNRGLVVRLGIYAGNALVIGVLGAVHYVARAALLVGTALTSPAKLTKDAWDFAHQLEIKNSHNEVNPKATKVLNKVLGFTGAILSVALTVALWAVALPFGIATLVKYVPQFMVAVNWVLSTPFIAPALAYVNGALTVVGGYLSVFLPLINTVAASAGLQVTTAMLAVGVSIGSIAAVVANIATPIIDAIGNWAAKRPSNAGPINWLLARRSAKKGGAGEELKDLGHDDDLGPATTAPRPTEEADDVEPVNPHHQAIQLLIANNKVQEALRVANHHKVRDMYFEETAEGGFTPKAIPQADDDYEAAPSDVIRALVEESNKLSDQAKRQLARSEAMYVATALADAKKSTTPPLATQLQEMVADIQATLPSESVVLK